MTTDAELPALIESLGLPGLVDLHVHFMPQNVLDKVWDFFDHVGDAPGTPPWTIAYRTGESERIAKLGELGVARFTALNYAHRPGMADWLNEYSAAFAAAHPQAIHSATFYPEPGVEKTVAAALAAGARIFKIHVQVSEIDPLDPVLDTAWDLVAEAATPVVIHCGNGPHRGTFTGPDPIFELVRRHPDLVLVIAHAGLPEYEQFARLALENPNVYLDTTMVATDYMNAIAPLPADLPELFARLSDRIVLGSDFPNIPYPYAHQIDALARLGLGDEWLRGVLWRNPVRLLGLDDRTAADASAANGPTDTHGEEQ